MKILEGKYGKAKVFTDNVEASAIEQIEELLNQPFVRGSKIRIMPDVHSGKGCVIGTTMAINDMVCPNLVGVDIGCGMYTVKLNLKDGEIDLAKFDEIVKEAIPAGFHTRTVPKHREIQEEFLNGLNCWDVIKNKDRILLSLGTLGGGNHFIELEKDAEGSLYLVIHTGSRNLGLQIANHYQRKAIRKIKSNNFHKIIDDLKARNMNKAISDALKREREKNREVPPHLAYLEGQDMEEYLSDIHMAQTWAKLNREGIALDIIKKVEELVGRYIEDLRFHTTHNFISGGILRKGAVSATLGRMLIIPMNMRDGSLLCVGKGNPDWNYSAPHGAGRIMSRAMARKTLTVDNFKKTMEGVYSSTVDNSTIDEAPMAYKPMEEIVNAIGETVDIVEHLTPVYNFKATDA